jgi:phosphate acetyltransferase
MLKLNSAKPVNIAGIVLTNGFKPSGAVGALLKEVKTWCRSCPCRPRPSRRSRPYPLHSRIYPGATRKITSALALFESHVDTQKLVDLLKTAKTAWSRPRCSSSPHPARQSPASASSCPGEEDRILYAAEQVLLRAIADVVLLGNEQKIRNKISHLGLNLPGVEIIQPVQSPHFRDFVATYHELRKEKGVTPDMAETIMADASYFGTMMVYKGLADGMVSGSINTTAHTVRPALQFIRTKPGFSIVSSVFLMCLKDRVLFYGDCAINPNPTAQQLAEIAVTSARTAQTFGWSRAWRCCPIPPARPARRRRRARARSHRPRAPDGAGAAHRRPHPVRRRRRSRRGPHQDARLQGRRPRHGVHLPRPQHRNNTYKPCSAPPAPSPSAPSSRPAQAGQRPVPRLHRRRHRNTVAITAIQAQAEK